VVVTDLFLPHQDGLALLRHVQHVAPHTRMPAGHGVRQAGNLSQTQRHCPARFPLVAYPAAASAVDEHGMKIAPEGV
jgi:hypothetical protein